MLWANLVPKNSGYGSKARRSFEAARYPISIFNTLIRGWAERRGWSFADPGLVCFLAAFFFLQFLLF
jgi:hypothetical protein